MLQLHHGKKDDLKELISAGVCVHCCFRYWNNQDLTCYRTSCDKIHERQEDPEVKDILDKAREQENQICVTCFGLYRILSDSNGAFADLIDTIAKRGYEVPDFAIVSKFPGTTLLREYAMVHHMKTCVPASSHRSFFDNKEIIRQLLISRLQEVFPGAKYDTESSLTITFQVDHVETNVEMDPFLLSNKENTRKRRRQQQQQNPESKGLTIEGYGAVTKALASLSSSQLTAFPDTKIPCPPRTNMQHPVTIQLSMERAPVYVKGRYCKYQRGLSQTPWIIDGERIGDSSVQEKIAQAIQPYFQARETKFHSAGREDIDVRMLGNGRPFVLELVDAKKVTHSTTVYQNMEQDMMHMHADHVEIKQVARATKEFFANLQLGAESKRKQYCCVVWVSKRLESDQVDMLNALTNLVVEQRTPVRVLHRRSLLTREKIIHSANVEVLNDHYLLLRLTTSAGTYVKEFIHGDLGRTMPNLGHLCDCEADILQLDVEQVIDDDGLS